MGTAYDLGAIEGTEPPWLRVRYPNGGEVLPSGGQATIGWESGAFVGPVRIELATSYATSPAWQTLATVTANDGSELVTLPAVRDASCRIRLSEAFDADPTDLSDADFEIGDAIIVLAPAGGESWSIGAPASIIWSSAGVTDVHIELSRDSGTSWETLADSEPAASGGYGWTATGPASNDCLVRLSDVDDDGPVGVSAAPFAIVEPAAPPPSAGDGAGDEEGCGCRTAGAPSPSNAASLGGLCALALLCRRRRGCARG